MAMLYDGCDCNSLPRSYLCREQAIWQCDVCLTIYQITEGEWTVIRNAVDASQALAQARLF